MPGNFTVYNGAITNISPYTTVNGSAIIKQLVITGVTAAGGGAQDVLILFGGHLARENEWGPGNGASSFPGASAKVLYQFCGESSFGNFAVNPSGIIKQADLSLTKTAAPNPLCAGNTLVYSLVVANAGPNQASPVTVLDALPPGTALSSVSLSQGTYSGTSNVNVALGAINAGSNATITLVVTVNTNAVLGTITNTATATAGAPADPYMLNNTATATTMVFPHPSASPLSDQVVCRGDSATFSTIAIGAPPFSYQWAHNGAYLAGATNSAYTIASVSPSDAGVYCVDRVRPMQWRVRYRDQLRLPDHEHECHHLTAERRGQVPGRNRHLQHHPRRQRAIHVRLEEGRRAHSGSHARRAYPH